LPVEGKKMAGRNLWWWLLCAGAALLFISFLGWEKPITDFTPKMPILFRIMGITGALLIVDYDDGSTVSYDAEDIKEHRLDVHPEGSEVIFKDGTKLRNLDRVSYRPVLRDRLRSRISSLKGQSIR